MIAQVTSLASKPDQRQLSLAISSTSALGLGASDIFKHGLVEPGLREERQFRPVLSSIREETFEALAEAKIWTAWVAMRLDIQSRDRFFRQLDLLHDCDEWFEGDKPLQLESYKCFIRFIIRLGKRTKPSLALSPTGQLLAVWEANRDRLTVEFRESDQVQWVVSCADGDRTAGITSSASLVSRLAPYNPDAWFGID